MAFSYVGERAYGRQSNDSPIDINNDRVLKIFNRTLLFETTDKTENETQIKAHAQCPKMGDTYPSDNNAIVISRKFRQLADSPYLWEVDLEYSSLPWPLVEWRYGCERTEKECEGAFRYGIGNQTKDVGLLTSAGEAIDPKPVLPVGRSQIFYIRRSVVAITFLDKLDESVWSTNSIGVTLNGKFYANDTLLLTDYSISTLFGFSEVWHEINVTMSVDSVDRWRYKPLDKGHYFFATEDDKANGRKSWFLDKDGNPVTGLLNGQGGKLNVFDANHPADLKYLDYQIYKSTDFRSLFN